MFRYMSKKDRRIKNLEAMVNNRDNLLAYQDECLKSARKINEEHHRINGELMTKIKDLENNIEFLTNNLSAQKRKQLGL